MFQLPSHRLTYLKAFLDIPSTQWHIEVPKLCSLIGKLHYMHLAVSGATGHFLYIQGEPTKAGTGTRDDLSKAFHQEIYNWKQLCDDSLAWPRFLAEVLRGLPTALGFCDNSGTGAGGSE